MRIEHAFSRVSRMEDPHPELEFLANVCGEAFVRKDGPLLLRLLLLIESLQNEPLTEWQQGFVEPLKLVTSMGRRAWEREEREREEREWREANPDETWW